MANRDLGNAARYGKHAFKCLSKGELGEAQAALRALALRVVEIVIEPLAAPRVRCNFCGWRGRRFRTFLAGSFVRRDAVCPGCLSLERHRAFLPLFEEVRALVPGRARVLDIAPMAAFSAYCRRRDDLEYLSIDLTSPVAMRHMDVQDLPLADASFDILVCYHVLDYVPDDRRALREIRRVMADHAIGILAEGVAHGRATEEWGVPRREALYRIRQYGDDFPERVREAGLWFVAATSPLREHDVLIVAKVPRPDLEQLVADPRFAHTDGGAMPHSRRWLRDDG